MDGLLERDIGRVTPDFNPFRIFFDEMWVGVLGVAYKLGNQSRTHTVWSS